MHNTANKKQHVMFVHKKLQTSHCYARTFQKLLKDIVVHMTGASPDVTLQEQ
jgi:hypothetical protein